MRDAARGAKASYLRAVGRDAAALRVSPQGNGAGRLYRRDGGAWYMDFTKDGKRYRESTGTRNREEAEGRMLRRIREAGAPPMLVAARKRAEEYKTIRQGGESMPRTQIFRQGEDVSVVTTAGDERDFVDTFTDALVPLMENGADARQKRAAVMAGFDIVAKLRGYKSDVQERRVLAAGRWPHPSETPIGEAGEDGEADE